MKKKHWKRGVAVLLATITMSMSVIPYLPDDILTAFAFKMNFNTSTSGDGHYDITGQMPGQPETQELYNEVVSFMNSFDWKNASDIEKATRICERIHQAPYDREATNDWNSLSYGAYGCLVKGKAVCQGYAEAAHLLGMAVGIKTMEMGDVGHTYPVFLVDGIWLANEPTTPDKYFTVADVYEYNPGYRLLQKTGGDLSVFTDVTKYQMLGQYCIQTGYTIPTDKEMLSQYGWVGEVFGKISIDFKPEYRTWK